MNNAAGGTSLFLITWIFSSQANKSTTTRSCSLATWVSEKLVFPSGKYSLEFFSKIISIRYAYGKFSNTHEATIGGCFLTKNEDLGDYIVKYEMWDTAGQERYRSLAQMYYKNAIGACVVFDVTSRDSFEKCQQWVKELNEKAGADIRIVIVGNKIDLEDHTVSKEEAMDYARGLGL